MRNKVANGKKGFTIIEVVLVLAVAALIFLIVFLAVPALQRNRRDTARKNDVGRAIAQLEGYASNHNGDYPSTIDATFITEYLDGKFKDPGAGSYSISTTAITDASAEGAMQYAKGGKCNDDSTVTVTPTNTRHVSVSVKLEQGVAYCQDNN